MRKRKAIRKKGVTSIKKPNLPCVPRNLLLHTTENCLKRYLQVPRNIRNGVFFFFNLQNCLLEQNWDAISKEKETSGCWVGNNLCVPHAYLGKMILLLCVFARSCSCGLSSSNIKLFSSSHSPPYFYMFFKLLESKFWFIHSFIHLFVETSVRHKPQPTGIIK